MLSLAQSHESVKRVQSDNLQVRPRNATIGSPPQFANIDLKTDRKKKKSFSRTSSVVTRFRPRRSPGNDNKLKVRSLEFAGGFSTPKQQKARRKKKPGDADVMALATAFNSVSNITLNIGRAHDIKQMLFSDKSLFLANYLLTTAGGNFKPILKALVELSLVEDCAAEFTFDVMVQECEKEGLFNLLFANRI